MGSQICYTSNSVTLHLDIRTEHLANQRFQPSKLYDEQLVVGYHREINEGSFREGIRSVLLTAKFPSAALAARCTSVSWLLRRKRIGSKVSRPTGRTSFSVISAKARAALLCRSTLSENESVVKADKGDPVKKLVVVRSVTNQ